MLTRQLVFLAKQVTISRVQLASIVLLIVSIALLLVVLYAKVGTFSILVSVTQVALTELLHQVQPVYWILVCTEPHSSLTVVFLVHPHTCCL